MNATPTVERRRIRVSPVASILIVAAVVAMPWLLTRCAVRSDANFADFEEFSGNRLGAGSVELSVKASDADPTAVLNGVPSAPGQSQIFSAANMAPGDSTTGSLSIANTGSLPLRYWISASAGPSSSPLADWLLYDIWRSPRCRDGIGAAIDVYSTNVVIGSEQLPLLGRPDGEDVVLRLEPGESASVCLGAHLPLSAPNEIQAGRLDIEMVVFAQHSPSPNDFESDQ